MKKIIFIISLIIINSFLLFKKLNTAYIENINLNLDINELGIMYLPIKNNESFIMSLNNKNILYLINYQNINIIESYLNKFNLNIDYIISNNNSLINNYYTLVLNNNLVVNDIYFSNKEYTEINYLKYKICINVSKINDCDFIYYINNNDVNINSQTKAVLYNNISNKNFNKLYSKYIDIYKLNNKTYNILKISNKYKIVEIPF